MQHQICPGGRDQAGLPGDAEFFLETGRNDADGCEIIHDQLKFGIAIEIAIERVQLLVPCVWFSILIPISGLSSHAT